MAVPSAQTLRQINKKQVLKIHLVNACRRLNRRRHFTSPSWPNLPINMPRRPVGVAAIKKEQLAKVMKGRMFIIDRVGVVWSGTTNEPGCHKNKLMCLY